MFAKIEVPKKNLLTGPERVVYTNKDQKTSTEQARNTKWAVNRQKRTPGSGHPRKDAAPAGWGGGRRSKPTELESL